MKEMAFRFRQLFGAGLGGGPIGLLWSYTDYVNGRLIEWRATLFVALTLIGILSGLFAICLEEKLEETTVDEEEEEWL